MSERSSEEPVGTPGSRPSVDADEGAVDDELSKYAAAEQTSAVTDQWLLPGSDGERVRTARTGLRHRSAGGYRGGIEVERGVAKYARMLTRQRNELAAVNRVAEFLLETAQELVQLSGRDTVERTACERLAESDLYQFAWVGERAFDGERLVPRTSAGEDALTPGAVTFTDDDSATGQGPGQRAMRTGEVQIAAVEETSFEPSHVTESVAAVPLPQRETVYGVLLVYTTRENAFGQREQDGLDVLGRIIGSVIHDAKRRGLLFADKIVELEFDVTGTDSAIASASAALDCRLSLDGYVTTPDQRILYLKVDGAPPVDVVEAVATEPQIERARVIDGPGDGLIELVMKESSLPHIVTAAGATLRTVTATADEARIVIEAPNDIDIREVFTYIESEFPESDLVARHEHDRGVTTADRPDGLLDELTERQREAVETAYRAGYFMWPRESTAVEVADTLEIAPPTLHAHLRKAQATMLEGLLNPDSSNRTNRK